MAESSPFSLYLNATSRKWSANTNLNVKILFEVPLVPNEIPSPHPTTLWEHRLVSGCVNMPWTKRDKQSCILYILSFILPKFIFNYLKRTSFEDELKAVNNPKDIENAIRAYNVGIPRTINFNVLNEFINYKLNDYTFFEDMRNLIKLTLDLPLIVTQPIPLLSRNKNQTLFLSQKQVSCLMANAFFCTFPDRNRGDTKLLSYSDINFMRYTKYSTLSN